HSLATTAIRRGGHAMAIATRRQPRIPLEELCRLPSFYLPAVSWKGDRVAFYWDKTGRMELHVMDLATRETRQVSHGEVPRALRAGFAWDRADRSIVFAKDSGGTEQHDLYRIDVETGAVTQLTNDPTAQEYVGQFSPDDQWLTVLTNKRHPASPDRPGQLNLWKMRADGTDYAPLTNYGRLLAAIRNFESSVRPSVYDVETGAAHELKLPDGFAVGASFFDSDRKLLVIFSSDVTLGSLVAYDLATDTYDTLLAAEYGTIDRSVFVEAKHLYYQTFDGR